MASAQNRGSPLSNTSTAYQFGCHELSFSSAETESSDNALPLRVDYRLPNGAIRSVHAFARKDGSASARSYIDEIGTWRWECKNKEGRCIRVGAFNAVESTLPGKLRACANDARQFQYHSTLPYLHFGYVCSLLLSEEATQWKSAIDQADQAGFTKIRVLLGNTDGNAEALFARERKRLNLSFWDEVDQRLTYALSRYPHIQFQIIPFANDFEEILRYGEGDPAAYLALRYAQERFSALPNIHWALTDGLLDTSEEEGSAKNTKELIASLKRMGSDMAEADPWGAMIGNIANRFSLAPLTDSPWHNYISISDIGQVTGKAILSHRVLATKPVALDHDRSEWENRPNYPRYYFRRLFWGALLSGGHPTYEGLNTSVIDDRPSNGVVGYYDACNSGRLRMGAHDLLHIRNFFQETGICLENWIPDDAIGGGNPLLVKTAKSSSETECIAYIANPEVHGGHSPDRFDGTHTDQLSNVSETFTTFTLELPFSSGRAKWFCPQTGEWKGDAEITRNSTTLLTPEPGDWIIWAKRD